MAGNLSHARGGDPKEEVPAPEFSSRRVLAHEDLDDAVTYLTDALTSPAGDQRSLLASTPLR
jgi:hypothetical protein